MKTKQRVYITTAGLVLWKLCCLWLMIYIYIERETYLLFDYNIIKKINKSITSIKTYFHDSKWSLPLPGIRRMHVLNAASSALVFRPWRVWVCMYTSVLSRFYPCSLLKEAKHSWSEKCCIRETCHHTWSFSTALIRLTHWWISVMSLCGESQIRCKMRFHSMMSENRCNKFCHLFDRFVFFSLRVGIILQRLY